MIKKICDNLFELILLIKKYKKNTEGKNIRI